MRSRVHFLVRLPYARLTCLLLAAIQLMPLPDEPENRSNRCPGIAWVGPDSWSSQTTLGRRDSYAA